MERENTATRLHYIIETRKLRQVDILTLAKPFCDKYQIKMNKSDISQYVSGKVEPNQKKLTILAMALDVNESWLAGYDVPMERLEYSIEMNDVSRNNTANALHRIQAYKDRLFDARLLNSFQKLSHSNKQKVIDYSDKLLSLQQMEEDVVMPVAAHANENASPEDIAYDNEIMDSDDF